MKPEAIMFYNNAKQGVDISDQVSAYHTAVRKSIKWYHKVAVELLLGTAVVNAHILYNNATTSKQLQITEFRERLAISLLKYGTDKGSAPLQLSESVHYLRETDEREEGKRTDRRKRRYCVGCYDIQSDKGGRDQARMKVRRVTTECAICEGHPRFCLPCFSLYHQQYGPI